MLLRRDEDLTAHVTALLRAGLLVLKMNPSGSRLDEQLGQLHHRTQPSVTWSARAVRYIRHEMNV